MAPIDLKKNQNEILKIHKEVSDPKSPINWALFGYEGKSSTLEVVSKGDGGIEEFLQELNTGRILYGYLKVIDPNSDLPKFVFINWQGEGVPEIVKGSSASHVRDVSNLLKGAHVSINARNEDDVDEETIVSKVAKSSGANYSFHKEQKRDVQPSGPVGSVYQKIKPQIELKPVLREKFWEDAAKEEKNRKESEKQRLTSERERMDKEIKERELQDSRKREDRENERLKKAKEIKAANQKADAPPKLDKSAWEREQEHAKSDERERAGRSEQLRKERAQEAQKLISSTTSQARSVFTQKPVSQFENKSKGAPPPPRKLVNAFEKVEAPPKIAVCPPKQPEPKTPSAAYEEEDIYDDNQPSQRNDDDDDDDVYDDNQPSRGNDDDDHDESFNNQPNVEETGEEIYNDTSFQPKASDLSHIAQSLPKRADSDDEEIYDDIPETGGDIYDDVTPVSKDNGLCAVALYDYQAAEDNEITFDPGDKIWDIDMIDDGWWIGTDKDGRRGMFPSNYVELTNP